MRRLPRIALLLLSLGAVMPVLAGCSGFDPENLDPFGFNSKTPLPGKRELLFPNGVPGVTQGIPPQYKEGYQAPAISDLPPGDTDGTPSAGASQTAKAAPTKPVQESNLGKPMRVHRAAAEHKAKPKHRRVVKRKMKPKPKATATAAKPATKTKTEAKGANAPWSSTPQQAKGADAPWPSTSNAAPPTSQSTQAGWPSSNNNQNDKQKLAPWPSAPPSGSFSKE